MLSHAACAICPLNRTGRPRQLLGPPPSTARKHGAADSRPGEAARLRQSPMSLTQPDPAQNSVEVRRPGPSLHFYGMPERRSWIRERPGDARRHDSGVKRLANLVVRWGPWRFRSRPAKVHPGAPGREAARDGFGSRRTRIGSGLPRTGRTSRPSLSFQSFAPAGRGPAPRLEVAGVAFCFPVMMIGRSAILT